MTKTKSMPKVAEDAIPVSTEVMGPDSCGDGEPEEGMATQLEQLRDDPGSEPEDDSPSAGIKGAAAGASESSNKKKKKGKGKGKAKKRILNDDGRMFAGCDPDLLARLPAKGDKVIHHKAGHKGQAKAHRAPIKPAVGEQKKAVERKKEAPKLAAKTTTIAKAEDRQATMDAEQRQKLIRKFKDRLVVLAFKGGRGRTMSLTSGSSTTPTTRRQRARSSDAALGTLTRDVRSATIAPTSTLVAVAQEGSTDGSDGVLTLGQEEGREEVAATGVLEQEVEGQGEDKPDFFDVSLDQAINMAKVDNNMGTASPRGCCSPTNDNNTAWSEDIVRQASSSGATEQAPSFGEMEGEGETDLHEQEGALDMSQGEGSGHQEEEPAFFVEVSSGAGNTRVEGEGDEGVALQDHMFSLSEGTMKEREADLQEQEGALDVSHGEVGGQEKEEEGLPFLLEMSAGVDTMVEEGGEGQEVVTVQDDVSLEQGRAAPSSFKENVVEVVRYIVYNICATYQAVTAAATSTWEHVCASCSAVAEAARSVCQHVYETICAWGTSA